MTDGNPMLGDVADFIRGVTYKPEDVTENFAEGSLVCMRTANVQATLDESSLVSIPGALVKNAEKLLSEGDLLVSTANSWNLVGKCCWVPRLDYAATAGGFIAILRGNDAKIDRRYLYHWFSSPKTQLEARNCGRQTTNISNMDINRCLAIRIPLPSLPEQRRIAAILDKAHALRAKRREALAKLDHLRSSLFINMFGDPASNPMRWPKISLAELGSIHTGKTPPTAVEGMFGGEIPFVTPGDLAADLSRSERTITDSGAEYTKVVRAGAALVGCIGNIGKVAKAPVACSFNQQINAVEWNSEIVDDDFGLAALTFQKPQMKALASATTVPILNKSGFSKVSIPVPPLKLQKQFAERVTAVASTASAGRVQLLNMDQLFSSLQNELFEAGGRDAR